MVDASVSDEIREGRDDANSRRRQRLEEVGREIAEYWGRTRKRETLEQEQEQEELDQEQKRCEQEEQEEQEREEKEERQTLLLHHSNKRRNNMAVAATVAFCMAHEQATASKRRAPPVGRPRLDASEYYADIDSSEDERAEARRKRKRQSRHVLAEKKQREKMLRLFDTILPRLREALHVDPAGGGGSREGAISEIQRTVWFAEKELELALIVKVTREAKAKVRAYEVYEKLRGHLQVELAEPIRDEACIEILERFVSDAFKCLKEQYS